MYIVLHVKYPIFLSDSNANIILLKVFRKVLSNIELRRKLSCGYWVVPCGWTDMTLIFALHNFANAPNRRHSYVDVHACSHTHTYVHALIIWAGRHPQFALWATDHQNISEDMGNRSQRNTRDHVPDYTVSQPTTPTYQLISSLVNNTCDARLSKSISTAWTTSWISTLVNNSNEEAYLCDADARAVTVVAINLSACHFRAIN
jgi:hypothetical protein